MRRLASHGLAFGHGRVAGADRRADGCKFDALLTSQFANFAERGFEILLDVVAEGFER
jgi:hypothetical protein